MVPGKVLRFRTFRVEWHLKHLASSTVTPLLRAGNLPLSVPSGFTTILPISAMGARTISWKRKFLSPPSHCMYSIALGWEPG